MAPDKGQTGRCNPIKHENFWFSSKSFLEPPSCNGNMKRKTSTYVKRTGSRRYLPKTAEHFWGSPHPLLDQPPKELE